MRKREQGMAQNIVIKDILLVIGRCIMKAPKELLCEDPGLAEIRGKTEATLSPLLGVKSCGEKEKKKSLPSKM